MAKKNVRNSFDLELTQQKQLEFSSRISFVSTQLLLNFLIDAFLLLSLLRYTTRHCHNVFLHTDMTQHAFIKFYVQIFYYWLSLLVNMTFNVTWVWCLYLYSSISYSCLPIEFDLVSLIELKKPNTLAKITRLNICKKKT